MQNDLVCKAAVLCEKTTAHPVHGTLTINGMLPEIALKLSAQGVEQVGDIPHLTNIPLELVLFFERTKRENALEREFTVELLDPSNKVLIKDAKVKVIMAPGYSKFFSVIKFEKGIPCTRPGEYRFRVTSVGDDSMSYEERFDVKMFDGNGKQLQ